MRQEGEIDRELYMAGHTVPPGVYKHLDSSYIHTLDGENMLPARLDGHVTYYVRIQPWREDRPSELLADRAPGGVR